jgi:integrase
MVMLRARLVDRFLDWEVEKGALLGNPLAELRKEYHQRATTPIVRALLSADFQNALETLRPLPRFGSFLGPLMSEYLDLKRAMGYRYDMHEQYMLRFDRFLQCQPDLNGRPFPVLIREWTKTASTAQNRLQFHEIGRMLSKALSRMDSTVKLIPWDPRIEREARQRHRQPYIFSEQEVGKLLETALDFPSPRAPLRPQTLHMMLVLAYCAGLRLGEIVRLNVGDVDVEDQAIDIRGTKFFKSRRLPVSPSVAAAIRSFLVARQQAGAPSKPYAGLFWHQQAAGRYSYVMAGKSLVRVFRRAGIKPEKGRIGPRIHDLRHAFVVNRMLKWYREGINPQDHLPYLATYLGHKDINSTLVYLTITQELLERAGERFRQFGAGRLGTSAGGDSWA